MYTSDSVTKNKSSTLPNPTQPYPTLPNLPPLPHYFAPHHPNPPPTPYSPLAEPSMPRGPYCRNYWRGQCHNKSLGYKKSCTKHSVTVKVTQNNGICWLFCICKYDLLFVTEPLVKLYSRKILLNYH